jgi:hypothetical protein
MKGVLPWSVRCNRRTGTRDCWPALAAQVGPVQNIFVLTVHYFTSFAPTAQEAGQAVVPGRLSLCVSEYVPVL